MKNIDFDFSRLPVSNDWSFKNVGLLERNYITHGYHRYPAKFIPQIVNKAISDFSNSGEFVLDPFGGCGTTLVEAKILGRQGLAFDVNPVAKLITKAKITKIPPHLLEEEYKKLIKLYSKAPRVFTTPHSERIKYWFYPKTIKQLDRLYWGINEIKNNDVKGFFLCAFSNILKNSSKWLMKGTKPQIDPKKRPGKVSQVFNTQVKSMIKKNTDFYILLKNVDENIKGKMKTCDSTKKYPLKSDSVDLIVTSPPYVTSYEYADLHQLTLLWLGDDKKRYPRWANYANHYTDFKSKFVGSKIKKIKYNTEEIGSVAIDILSRLPKTKNYSLSVARYYSDMNKSFKEMYRVLKPGKKVCLVIGNTILRGVEVKNAEVAVQQMKNIGFQTYKIIKREISSKLFTSWRDSTSGKFTNSQNLNKRRIYQYEYVVLMTKPTSNFKR